MTEHSNQAFSGLATVYHSHRPRYPEPLVDLLVSTFSDSVSSGHWPSNALIVDVGSGTGIMTHQLAEKLSESIHIVGIEPNHDMRKIAVESGQPSNVTFLDGYAEHLPFEDTTVSAILACQALQWFNRPRFYSECKRVLHHSGLISIAQNNRNWEGDEFLNAYEELLESFSNGYTRHYRSFDVAAELTSHGFNLLSKPIFRWKRAMSEEEFLGMSLSSTKMQRAVKSHGDKFMKDKIMNLTHKFWNGITMRDINYNTELFLYTFDDDAHSGQ